MTQFLGLITCLSILEKNGGYMNIESRVKDLIIDKLGVSEDQIVEDAHFIDDLGADSLDTVELVMALEEEFDVEIPDEEAEKLTTVGAAINYLKSKASE